MRNGLTGVVAVIGGALVVGTLVVDTAGAQTPFQGHDQMLDEAVKAGQLTQTQADLMKQHHQWMQQNGGFGMMAGGMGMHGRWTMGGRGGG